MTPNALPADGGRRDHGLAMPASGAAERRRWLAGPFGPRLRVVAGGAHMKELTRITTDPQVMGGKPCIRGLRVTVGTIVGLVAAGRSKEEILKLYPYLEEPDIAEALSYAAWRAEEIEVPLARA